MFKGKRILLGITGSIAAYKMPKIVDELVKLGAYVRVVLTHNATHFVTPMSLEALGAQAVRSNLFDAEAERAMSHIELSRWADCCVIAPCTANTIAHLRLGVACDLLSTIILAFKGPVMVVPAMNPVMWENPVTTENVAALKARDVLFAGPCFGDHACGELGNGRFLDWQAILLHIASLFVGNDLKGKKVVVSAGACEAPIDPVRMISNKSSGKMGFAIANAAVNLGATVHLVSANVQADLHHIAHHHVVAKQVHEMKNVLFEQLKDADIFVSVAAVSDYCVETILPHKLEKKLPQWQLNLLRNEDILMQAVKHFKGLYCIGFAAETDKKRAAEKLLKKNLDALVVNEVSDILGFGSQENEVDLLFKKGACIHFAKQHKFDLAHLIWGSIIQEYVKN